METSFMSTENSKANESHKFRLTLADKTNEMVNLSIYYT